MDQPVAALLDDLKAQRSFRRNAGDLRKRVRPDSGGGNECAVKVQNGRDHNPFGFSIWLAGGGVKGGMAYGATDDFGFKASGKPSMFTTCMRPCCI